MKGILLAIAAFFTLASAATAQSFSPEQVVAMTGQRQPVEAPPPVVTQPVRPAPAPTPPPARVERPRPEPVSYVAPARERPIREGAPLARHGKGEYATAPGKPQGFAPVAQPASQPVPSGWQYDARIDRARCQSGYGRPRFVDEARHAGYQGCYVPPGGLAHPEARQRSPGSRPGPYRPRPYRPLYVPQHRY